MGMWQAAIGNIIRVFTAHEAGPPTIGLSANALWNLTSATYGILVLPHPHYYHRGSITILIFTD